MQSGYVQYGSSALTIRHARILRLSPRPLPGNLGVAIEACGGVAVELFLLLAVVGCVTKAVVLVLAEPALAACNVEASHHFVALLDVLDLEETGGKVLRNGNKALFC